MATSPFYCVLLAANNRDITDLISQFTFEDCTDKDDLLRLTINNAPLSLVDDKDLAEGKKLLFSWGYLGGEQSKQHTAIITAVEPRFTNSISLSISASDSGVVMKKANPTQHHQGKTASDIAAEIARKHGLKAQVEISSKVWKSLPQAGRTDFELLKYLAAHEPGGQFRFMVKGDTLHFTKLDLKKPSRRTFRYNDGSGDVISFSPRSNASNKKAASAETKVPGVDPYKGKPFTGVAKEGETKQDPKLGNYRIHYDADANQVNRDRAVPAPAVSRTVITPSHNSVAASAVADKEKKTAAMSDVTASLVTVGDPNLSADEIISMSGVGATFGGNWYLQKVTHSLGTGFYQCSSELARNATNKAASASTPKSEDKNTSTGPSKTDARRAVRIVYDQNSNQVK